LGTRDASVNDLTNAFDFNNEPERMPRRAGW